MTFSTVTRRVSSHSVTSSLREEYLLEGAALDRARRERQVIDAVIAARAAGASCQKIGRFLGTSAQASQQRYASVVESV